MDTMDTISTLEPFNSSSSSLSRFRSEEHKEEDDSLLKVKEEAREKGEENLLTRREDVVESAAPTSSSEIFSSVSGTRIGEMFRGWIPSKPKLQRPESSDAAGLGIPERKTELRQQQRVLKFIDLT